ncbi:tape measure protein [Nocardiaceae bacterium NPDC056970]
MSLNVGTLKAVLTLDDSEFNTRLQRAPQALTSLDQAVSQTGARLSGKLGQAGEQGGRELGSKLSSSATASASAAGDKAGQGFGQRFNASLSSAVSSASQELQSRLGVELPTSAADVGRVAGGALADALSKGWNRLSSIENAQAKLSGLGHSAQDVSAIMQNAADAVKSTAFGVDEAASTAAGAVAAGIKPGEDLQKTLTLVGDSATIAGMGMTEMGAIWNEVATSNKVQGDVLAQLSGAGIPIVQLLGKELGTAAEETLKLASDGKINFETFRNAMEKGLGGAAQKAGETVSGEFKNMGTAVANFGAVLAQPIFDNAGGVMGGVTAGIDGAGAAVKAAQGAFDGLPAPVQASIGALAAVKVASMALGTTIGQQVTGKITGAGNALANLGRSGSGQVTGYLGSVREAYRYAGVSAEGFGGKVKAGMSVAGSAVAHGAGAMRSGLSNLVGFMGGPLGIGVMAATALWVNHSSEVAKAKAQNEQISAAVSDTATVLSTTGGKYSEAGQQAAAAALETIKLKDGTTSLGEALSKAGVPLDQAAKGLAGMGDAAAKTREQVEEAHRAERENLSWAEKRWQEFTGAFSGANKDRQYWNDKSGRWETDYDTDQTETLRAYDKAQEAIKAKQDAIKREAQAGGFKLDVAPDGTVAIDGMVESLKEFEANAKGAAAGVDILTGALNKMSDDQFTVHDAQAKVNESFRELQGLAGTLGNVGLDGSGLIDTKTKEGAAADKAARSAAESYKELAASLYESGLRGQGLTDALQPQYDQFLNLATAMLGSREQAETLAKSLGLIPSDVQVTLDMKNAANSKTLLDSIGNQFKDFDGTTSTITVESLTDDAEAALKGIGFEVKQIPGTTEFTIVPKDGAKAAFDAVDGVRGVIEGIPKAVAITIDTPGYAGVMAGLELLGIKVHADNEKHIVIGDNSPETRARLAELNIKTTTLDDGRIVIADNSVDVAGNIDRNLKDKKTTGQHTVEVAYREAITQQLLEVGVNYGEAASMLGVPMAADGGIRQRADGMLDTAHIANGRGLGTFAQSPLGPVQYAEGETWWESYIPGAPSKRSRSLAILKETARRFGYSIVDRRAVMADGGVVESMSDLVRKNFPGLTITDSYRPGANDNHGAGLAIDVSNGFGNTDEQLAFANWVADNYPDSKELIYDDPRFDRQIKEGNVVDSSFYAGAGDHTNHVHWAMGAAPGEPGGSGAGGSGAEAADDGQRVFVTNWPSASGYGGVASPAPSSSAPSAPSPTDQLARESPSEVKEYEVTTPQERMAEWTEQTGQDWLDSFGIKPGGAVGALMDAGRELENVQALEQMVEVLRIIAEDPPVQVVINAKDGDDAVRKWQEYIGGKSLSWIK